MRTKGSLVDFNWESLEGRQLDATVGTFTPQTVMSKSRMLQSLCVAISQKRKLRLIKKQRLCSLRQCLTTFLFSRYDGAAAGFLAFSWRAAFLYTYTWREYEHESTGPRIGRYLTTGSGTTKAFLPLKALGCKT